MARITIIPEDNSMSVDGVGQGGLDLSSCNIPSNVSALQWDGTEGEIEFDTAIDNEVITELPAWATACQAIWQTSKDEEDAKESGDLGLENGYDPNNLSDAFVSLSDAEKESLFKQDRNQRLTATDWTQLPDVVAVKPAQWVEDFKVYRQALRDLAPTDFDNVFFPELPHPID